MVILQNRTRQSIFSAKLLASCAVIACGAFTSTGYASTYEIDLPVGTSSVPSITAAAGTVTISGAGVTSILDITGAATYNSATVTNISDALVNIANATALGSASTNTVTLTGTGALQAGGAYTLPNAVILAASSTGAIDLNGNATTITPAITGAGTSFAINSTGSAATLTLSAAATHTAPTTIAANATVLAGVSNVIADATSLAVAGTFDLNANANLVNNLSGAGTVKSTGSNAALSVAVAASSPNFSGTIASTVSGLTAYSADGHFLDLTGATNSMASGTITVGNGTGQAGGIIIKAPANLGTGTSLALAGGTLQQAAAFTAGAIPQAIALTTATTSTFDANNQAASLTGPISGSGTLTLASTGGTSATTTTLTPSATNSSFSGVLKVTGGTALLSNYMVLGGANATATPTCTSITASTGTKISLGAAMVLPPITFS